MKLTQILTAVDWKIVILRTYWTPSTLLDFLIVAAVEADRAKLCDDTFDIKSFSGTFDAKVYKSTPLSRTAVLALIFVSLLL